MKRLIKDAEKISGKDLSIKNYSDIIEAIHIIQEDMGITGATAAEAADTIQGSMNAASAAIKNLMAGLADENADLGKLTGNVVDSVSTAAGNIVPRVKITLGAIAGLADTYSDEVANFAADMLVNLTAQAPAAAKTVTNTVKTAIRAIDARKDDIAESAEELFGVLLTSFEDVMDDIYPFIERLTPTIASGFLRGTGTMFSVGTNIIMSFVRGLASNPEELTNAAFETVNTIVTTIDGNTDEFLAAGWTILSAIGDGVLQNLPQLAESSGSIVGKIIDFAEEKAPDLLAFGVTLLTTIADGVSDNLPTLLPAAVGLIGELAADITEPENLDKIFESAIDLLIALADGVVDSVPILLEKAPMIIENLITALGENAPDLIFAALEIIGKLREGLGDPETLGKLAGAALDIIGSLILGLATYHTKMWEAGGDMLEEIKDGFMEFIDDPFSWGKDLIDNFISGIKDGWSSLKSTVSDTAQKVKDFLGFSEPKEGPLSNFHTYAPDMMDLFIKGIKDNENKLTDQIEKTFDFGERTLDFGAGNRYIATVEQDDATLTKSGVQGGKSGGNNITVNITIEGGEYESETALAEEIARVLQKLFARKEFA